MDVVGMVAEVTSHAERVGLFGVTRAHEPKSAPMSGLSVAVWADSVRAVPARSVLNATAARLVLNIRIYQSMLSEPQDAIDPAVMSAVDALLTAYCGDFTLGGTVANVDILGAHGQVLEARAGYLQQDGKMFRVMTIALPLIINDAWPQAE